MGMRGDADAPCPPRSPASLSQPQGSLLQGQERELTLWLTNELNMKIVARCTMVNAHEGGNHRFCFIEGNGVRLLALMYLTLQRT